MISRKLRQKIRRVLSGDLWRPRQTVQSCPHIDVRLWQRKGLLVPGMIFFWPGRLGHADDLRVRVEETRVVLRYRVQAYGNITAAILMTWTLCHFGGQRPWFECPGRERRRRCGQRVAVLYKVGGFFLCRQCGGLTYQSQRQNSLSRLRSKARKIRLRLGGDTDLHTPLPPKPKRMHARTYARLRQEGEEIESLLLAAMGQKLQHLQQKLDRLPLRRASGS
jgi:hypothetical protein